LDVQLIVVIKHHNTISVLKYHTLEMHYTFCLEGMLVLKA